MIAETAACVLCRGAVGYDERPVGRLGQHQFASGLAQILGLAAWLLMALAFQPILRFYRVSPLWGVALPAIAATYMAFTLDSAYQHARGRGGMWKGRAQANLQDASLQEANLHNGNVSEPR